MGAVVTETDVDALIRQVDELDRLMLPSPVLKDGNRRAGPRACSDGRALTAPSVRPLLRARTCSPILRSERPTRVRRKPMADDKTKTGNPDRLLVNVNEPYELRDWSKKLGVTPEQLRAAVAAVGTSAVKVRKYLAK